jgi:FtsP/CotA-like multicopper oxidase with cupredoxin domain
VVLGPGERADLLVVPRQNEPGPLVLMNVPFDRGFGSTEFRTPDDLIAFQPADLPPVPDVQLPAVTRDIAPMTIDGAKPVNIELVTTKEHGITAFAIKGGPFWRDTSVRAALGEKQIWTITNKAIWAHPIHLHGFFFQEIDEKGVPVWRARGRRSTCPPNRHDGSGEARQARIVDVSLPHPRPRGGG